MRLSTFVAIKREAGFATLRIRLEKGNYRFEEDGLDLDTTAKSKDEVAKVLLDFVRRVWPKGRTPVITSRKYTLGQNPNPDGKRWAVLDKRGDSVAEDDNIGKLIKRALRGLMK